MKIQHDVSSIIQPCGPMFKHCGFPVKIWSRAHLAGLEHITLGHHIKVKVRIEYPLFQELSRTVIN